MPVSPLGFEVWIEVAGKRLEEFKLESEGKKMVCWVPCEAGQEFRVACSIPKERRRAAGHSVHIGLDGIVASLLGNLIYQDKIASDCTMRFFSEGLVNQDTATRAFQFGALELTDDDTLLHAPTKRFGEIKVGVDSVAGFTRANAPYVARVKQFDDNRIHERSKKGLAHCVKLGEEKPVAAVSPIFQAAKRQRVCTFVFKYRQYDILVADGIAPRKALLSTSTPKVSGKSEPTAKRKLVNGDVKDGETALHDSTDEQIKVMEGQLAALKAKKARDEASGSQPAAKRVKKEHSYTRRSH